MSDSEPDSCRICRGEATPEEPLFHPCKCSGSIRYVHQDCLMEWLKHSQRSNYCELCHSRFIITNLYANDMPTQLPVVVLIKSLGSQFVSLTKKLLRIMLVAFVWLLYFPMVTRYAVRYYFKLSDGPIPQLQNGNATAPAVNIDQHQAPFSLFHISISGGSLARDVLEGQGICGFVLLGFLSIFFIREWIIQNGAFRFDHAEHDAAVADIMDEQRLVAEVQGILAQGRQRRLAAQHQQQQQHPPAQREREEEEEERNRNNDNNNIGNNAAEPYRIETDIGASSSSSQADMEGLRARRLMHFQGPIQEGDDEGSDSNSNQAIQGTANEQQEPNIDNNENEEERIRDRQYQRVIEAAAAFAENPDNDLDVDGEEEEEEEEEAEDDDDNEPEGLEARFDEGVLGDGDDLDGVMELIGLQGSISMLIQNGLVATMLMTGVLGICLFFPYVVGKLFFLLMLYPTDLLIRFPIKTLLFLSDEILDGVVVFMSDFSSRVSRVITLLSGDLIKFSGKLSIESQQSVARWAWSRLLTRSSKAWDILWNRNSPEALWNSVLHRNHIGTSTSSNNNNNNNTILSITALDRSIAIGVGYGVILTCGYLYLSRIRNQSRRTRDRRVFEFMNQTAFVLKVVFVIGLEMAIFPVFCGFLLDIAFLPLFERATISGRIASFEKNPYIHILAHWLLGTCYMFHFSLFVSFLRQIFRPGVLFFVRDPNDPAFKPMQDILDRPLLSHLRKIAISAFIYMMLIVLCIGSVVWSLAYGFGDAILPLRLVGNINNNSATATATAAVAQHGAARLRGALTEFSIDGTLYNLLLPYFVSGIRFSNLMRKMWVWYFEHACHQLRLSHFILSKRRHDEEGYNQDDGFINDGYFVRAPDSDHTPLVRTDSGSDFKLDKKFFTAVNEDDVLLNHNDDDGHDEEEDDNTNSSMEARASVGSTTSSSSSTDTSYTVVYRPPKFWFRIDLLLFGMWVFATGIGLTFTVLPLIVGRVVLGKLSGVSTLEIRDSYTLSVGLLIISGFIVVAEGIMKNWDSIIQKVKNNKQESSTRRNFVKNIGLVKIFQIGYVYFMLVIVVPSLLTITADLYIGIPVLTFIYKQEPIIHFSQEYIITMIYIQSGYQIASAIRPDNAINIGISRIFSNGMMNPNLLNANKIIIFPCLKVLSSMIILPGIFGLIAHKLLLLSSSSTICVRAAYPLVLLFATLSTFAFILGKLLHKWHNQIRDEVYLVGRQLHNMPQR